MFSPSVKVVSFLIKPLVFVSALIPVALLVLQALTDELGANPVETLTHKSGLWGLYFLLMTLAITPVRRFAAMPWLLRLRRMLGLFAFFYASLHVLVYFWLDQYFLFDAILDDIVKRPYITVGFTAWLLLLPLALTSFKRAMKKLGSRWKSLHQTVYLIVFLVLLHFLWLVKADLLEPLLYLLLYLILLAGRLPSLGKFTLNKHSTG